MLFNWPVLCLYLAASLDCVLAALALGRRNLLAARPYALASLVSAIWSVTYALDLGTANLETKIRLIQIRFLFLPFLTPLWFETMYRLVRSRRCLTGWLLGVALVVPAVTAALAWLPGPGFNPFFRHDFHLAVAAGIPLLRFSPGPWSNAYNVYVYTLSIAGWIVLLRSLRHAGWERSARLIMLAAWLISAAADLLWTFGLSRPIGLNYQPLLTPLVNLLIAYAIFGGRLLDLAPVVRAALVENLEDFLVVFDLRHRVVDINRSAAAALGTTPQGAINRPVAELLAGWSQVAAHLDDPKGKHEVNLGPSICELTFYPAADDGGRRCATLLILRDVTIRRRAEIEAARSRDLAQSADQAKGRFLAMMSHEIRTPMNGLLGFTDLLAETSLTAEQREYLGYITESGKSLLVIINDVLDFSKIEAGELHLERIAVDLRALLANTCATLAPRARAKRLTLQWKIDRQVPGLVFGDPVRLRQIITNLAGNALKFTAHGSIEIEIAPIGGEEEAGGRTIALIVRDTGIGITPENLERIFRPFSQADTSTTRRYGGTGLGLAITRRLCELMAGELEVSSVPDEGSVFTARVRVALTPGAAADDGPPQAAPTAPPEPRAILVFEDNPINERLITTVLKQAGHTVRSVPNGLSGLGVLETGARFDVIFMDLQMPGLDGYAVVQEIRRREAAGGPAHYIIALTAHALKGERQRCLNAGMNDYLAKPVDHAALWAALSRAPAPRRQ